MLVILNNLFPTPFGTEPTNETLCYNVYKEVIVMKIANKEMFDKYKYILMLDMDLDELDELDVVPAASTCWGRTKDKTIIIANTNVAIRDQI